MAISGILLGLINIGIVVVVLLLVGAIAAWVLSALSFTVPTEVRKLYLLVVAMIALYMVVALLLGMPSIHVLR